MGNVDQIDDHRYHLYCDGEIFVYVLWIGLDEGNHIHFLHRWRQPLRAVQQRWTCAVRMGDQRYFGLSRRRPEHGSDRDHVAQTERIGDEHHVADVTSRP